MSEIHAYRSRRGFKARIGLAGYVTLLGSMSRHPTDINSLAMRLGWGRDTCYRLVPQFHKRGRLHISDWRIAPRKVPIAIYAYGPGEDAPAPTLTPDGRQRSPVRILRPEKMSPEVIAFCNVLDELETASSIKEIKAATGIHHDTARQICAALRREKLGYIERYLPRDGCGGTYMAMFKLGQRKDASYPNPKALRRKTVKAWQQRSAANQPMRDLIAALQPPVAQAA
jgi:hypothetical protein